MGSGPGGREWVDAGVGTKGGGGVTGRLNYSETRDSLIERRPHCTDVFTPVSISHFTPGLSPDRICSATSFYPQIHNRQPPVKRGYSALSIATSPPSPSPSLKPLSPVSLPPLLPPLSPSLPCCYQRGNSMVLLQINNQYCINASAEATWS